MKGAAPKRCEPTLNWCPERASLAKLSGACLIMARAHPQTKLRPVLCMMVPPPPCPPKCGHCCLHAVDWDRMDIVRTGQLVCVLCSPHRGQHNSRGKNKTAIAFWGYAPPRTRPHLCHHRARKWVFAAPAPSAETAFARAQWIKRCVHLVHVTHTYAHALGFVICVVGSRTDPLPAHVPPRAAMAPRCGYC